MGDRVDTYTQMSIGHRSAKRDPLAALPCSRLEAFDVEENWFSRQTPTEDDADPHESRRGPTLALPGPRLEGAGKQHGPQSQVKPGHAKDLSYVSDKARGVLMTDTSRRAARLVADNPAWTCLYIESLLIPALLHGPWGKTCRLVPFSLSLLSGCQHISKFEDLRFRGCPCFEPLRSYSRK